MVLGAVWILLNVLNPSFSLEYLALNLNSFALQHRFVLICMIFLSFHLVAVQPNNLPIWFAKWTLLIFFQKLMHLLNWIRTFFLSCRALWANHDFSSRLVIPCPFHYTAVEPVRLLLNLHIIQISLLNISWLFLLAPFICNNFQIWSHHQHIRLIYLRTSLSQIQYWGFFCVEDRAWFFFVVRTMLLTRIFSQVSMSGRITSRRWFIPNRHRKLHPLHRWVSEVDLRRFLSFTTISNFHQMSL